MPIRNAGGSELSKLVRPRIPLNELAKRTGIGRPRLRRLMAGTLPNAQEMGVLQREAGIALEAWTQPAPPDDEEETIDGDDGDKE